MIIRTILLEVYVNLVDTTLKQNTCFKNPKFIFVVVVSLFFLFYLNTELKNLFSLQQVFKTLNVDANSTSRQYKVNLRADFMRIKYENPKLKQSEIADQLGYSSSTLQRYRNDINMLPPYRILSNNTDKRTKRLQILILTTISILNMNSKDFKRSQSISEFLLKLNPLKLKTNWKVKQILELTINISMKFSIRMTLKWN